MYGRIMPLLHAPAYAGVHGDHDWLLASAWVCNKCIGEPRDRMVPGSSGDVSVDANKCRRSAPEGDGASEELRIDVEAPASAGSFSPAWSGAVRVRS